MSAFNQSSDPLSAAQLLEQIKTVDGAGSGLDADLVDGRQPAAANGVATLDANTRLPASQLPVDTDLVIRGSVDLTKGFKVEADTQGAGFVLTLDVGAQTASRTLSAPVLTASATLAVLSLVQSWSAQQIFNDSIGVGITATSGKGLVQINGALRMLSATGGDFTGGVWSRDANWGTYYKAPASGATYDLGLIDSGGTGGLHVTTGGRVLVGPTNVPAANTFAGNIILGVNDATAAAAGQVGEYIESIISAPTNAAASGTNLALTSITLTAGDWDISALAVGVTNGATMSGDEAGACIGTTAAGTAGTNVGHDRAEGPQSTAGTARYVALCIPRKRVQVTATTTYYLNVKANFTAGTPQWVGSISARRIR